jgi:DNA-binding GntR family transcriptional regulator
MAVIQRKPLREQVQREIRERIVDGRLPAGESLNEIRLAGELGISRTPLREAMLGLEAAGFLVSAMGRGFRVPPLAASEFRDLAAMLARLEPLAVESSPGPGGPRVMEMQNLLQRARLSAAGGGERAAGAAAVLLPGFASLMHAGCTNLALQQDVLRLHALCARYWHAAVMAGFQAAHVAEYAEALYSDVQARRSADAAARIGAALFPLADQAAAVLG